jgi:putative membrane protein
MARTKHHKPAIFAPDDPALSIETPPQPEETATEAAPEAGLPVPVPAAEPARWRRAMGWGAILLSSLAALVAFGAGLAATRLVEDLFTRSDWLGWLALGLAGLAGLALVMIVLREVAGLIRLTRITHLRREAERAHRNEDMTEARAVSARLRRLYAGRRDLDWARARLAEHEADIFDADDLMRLVEREYLKGLDARAAAEVARAARRVSIVTAVSPAAIVDMGFVLIANLGLMRRLASLYGGRPGALGLLRLARSVVAHLTVTGGLALSDSLLQQFLGHGLAARLSARLGEGVLNGLFTARIGLAAIDVCRPLPFLALEPPAIKQVMSEAVQASSGRD